MAIKKAITTFGTLGILPMTSAERDLITNGLSNKAAIGYNSDSDQFEFYQAQQWIPLPDAGIGNVTGEAPTVVNNIAAWDNTTGTLLKDTGIRTLWDPALNNFFIGTLAGNTGVTGQNNFGAGKISLFSLTSGDANTSIDQSLGALTTGDGNFGGGFSALQALIDGNDNVGLGASALALSQHGSQCTAVGILALQKSLADDNVGIGYQAGKEITTGIKNTCVGATAGPTNENAASNQNTFLGEGATTGTTVISNATAIGADSVVDIDNAVVLGNGCNVGIGMSDPFYGIDIGDEGETRPGVYIKGSTVTYSAPPNVGDGLFYVGKNAHGAVGLPIFTSGTDTYSGTIVTATLAKTAGTINYLTGTTGNTITINTTAVTEDTLIYVSADLSDVGFQAAPPIVTVGAQSPGVSFEIYVPTTAYNFTINWLIVNPI